MLEAGPRHGYAVAEALRSGSGGMFEPRVIETIPTADYRITDP